MTIKIEYAATPEMLTSIQEMIESHRKEVEVLEDMLYRSSQREMNLQGRLGLALSGEATRELEMEGLKDRITKLEQRIEERDRTLDHLSDALHASVASDNGLETARDSLISSQDVLIEAQADLIDLLKQELSAWDNSQYAARCPRPDPEWAREARKILKGENP